ERRRAIADERREYENNDRDSGPDQTAHVPVSPMDASRRLWGELAPSVVERSTSAACRRRTLLRLSPWVSERRLCAPPALERVLCAQRVPHRSEAKPAHSRPSAWRNPRAPGASRSPASSPALCR